LLSTGWFQERNRA